MDSCPEQPAYHPTDEQLAAYLDWLLEGAPGDCPVPEVMGHAGECPVCYRQVEHLLLAHLAALREARPASFLLCLADPWRDSLLLWVSDSGQCLRCRLGRLQMRSLGRHGNAPPPADPEPTRGAAAALPNLTAEARALYPTVVKPRESGGGPAQRRSFPRYRCCLEILHPQGSERRLGRVANIGPGGLCANLLSEQADASYDLDLWEPSSAQRFPLHVERVWWDAEGQKGGFRFPAPLCDLTGSPTSAALDPPQQWAVFRFPTLPDESDAPAFPEEEAQVGDSEKGSLLELEGLRLRVWGDREPQGCRVLISVSDRNSGRAVPDALLSLLDEDGRLLREDTAPHGLVLWSDLEPRRYEVRVLA